MPTEVWANMIVKIGCDDDKVLFTAAIASIGKVVDRILILDMTGEGDTYLGDAMSFVPNDVKSKVLFLVELPDFCSREGFAAARNILLDKTPVGAYVLWVDSDECHFSKELAQLLQLVRKGFFDEVSTHFIHFCLGSNFYEKFEERRNIFRRFATTRWEGKVHERIVHDQPDLKIFYSDYIYHHYGYVRSQEYVFSRWYQYALLEGQTKPYEIEEEAGQTVPYFRGDKPDPSKLLEHRRSSLLAYFGEYPAELPQDWVKEKMITIT